MKMIRSTARTGSGRFVWFVLATLPLSACAATSAPTDIYSGYFRQGFEQSDFYTEDGDGPYWLTGSEEVYEELLTYLVRKEGRGSYITVQLTVRGELEKDGEFGLGYHDTQITVNEIVDIKTISPEEFDHVIAAFMSDRYKPSPGAEG